MVDFKVENNEKNKNFNIQKRELFDFNANFIPHEDLSNCFTEIFELIKKEIEFLPNSDVELIPYFENSKKLKIYYNHNNIFFSTQNKRCKIALRKHNSNNVNTIISIYTLDVFQRCLDADCEKKKDNGVDFICCLKDLLSESLLSKINEIIAKIYYESKAKLNEEQEIKYLELYNNILDNFF